jgi:hypothetical protein
MAAMIKCATKLQSLMRVAIARAAIIHDMQQSGKLVAMPGTVQGQSGWYEMRRNGACMVAKLILDDRGRWVLDKNKAIVKKVHFVPSKEPKASIRSIHPQHDAENLEVVA